MKILNKLFLPSGKYSPKYVNYLKWSFLSNVIVSIQSAMSTHSMLDVLSDDMGGGYKTINYIGKDIIGQVGALFYISKMGEKADKEPERFLLYSNAIQQTSFFMVSCTPLVSNTMFLPIAGVSNVFSNISFTGYGAVNAKCIQMISEDNNIGEVYSKLTTVNTMASSIGLSVGVGICIYIPDHESRLCFLPLLGALRIYTYNRAIKNLIV